MFNNQIIAGSSGQGGGFYDYSINQSVRFSDNHQLDRTATAGNQSTWTFSAWIKRCELGTTQYIWTPYYGGDGANESAFRFTTADQINVYDSGASRGQVTTKAVFRDVSAWLHLVVVLDLTESTATDRLKIYVNGNLQEITTNNSIGTAVWGWNANSNTHRLGGYARNTTSNLVGYMAEINFVDGTALTPSTFGETKNGVWVPKEVSGVTYGTNGFRVDFADSSDLGNNANSTDGTNDFTTVTGLTASDVVPDSPTLNYSTIVRMPNTSLSEGNLKLTTSRTGNWDGTIGSFGVTSGKWYHEVRFSKTETNFRCVAGWIGNQASQTVTLNGKGGTSSPFSTLFDNYAVTSWVTAFYKDGGTSGTMTAPASGDVMNIAADFDNGKIWFGVNGTYYANDGGTDGDPGAGTNESLSGIDLTASEYVPFFAIRSDNTAGGNVMIANFGQEGTFAGTETDGGYSDGNGYGSFFNSVPSGFLALNSANLPEPTIGPNSGVGEQSEDYFNTVLYTGNGTGQSITTGHASDFVWLKTRALAYQHSLYDSVRGGRYRLASDQVLAEVDNASANLQSFDTDGFTVGTLINDNQNAATYVGWSWRAGGTAVSNTDGTITSSVSANQDAGTSIVGYTGNATAGATVGHGLSSAPEMIIVKVRSQAYNWTVYHSGTASDAETDYLVLDGTAAANDLNTVWNDTAPTNSVFSLGTFARVNAVSETFIAYCFHSVEGFSKVGKYTGNGNANGTFVYTGFRPAWVMIKRTDTTGSWNIADAVRSPDNEVDEQLQANLTNAESTTFDFDFTSNGFKARTTDSARNASGGTYIYLAFAEAPFKYANAR